MNLRSLLCLALFLITLPLRAQLDVTLQVERTNYVSWEPLIVTVTITNTSGNDFVLGGPNNGPWLNFLITGDGNRPVTALGELDVPAIMCRRGQTLQRKFNLPRHYHLTQSGAYVIRAAAYFPELQRWVQSRPSRVTIAQAARPKWEQAFAAPGGHRMGGKYRRYQLFTFHDIDRTYLYVRVIDEGTGIFIATYRLCSVVPDRDAQPAVDRNMNLHVLCLGGPQTWAYHVIDPDGRITKQEFLRHDKGAPKLVTQPSGQVYVVGGTLYDPSRPAVAAPTDRVRSISERPAGVQLR